ncbi:DUF58 domain-containing protein [Reinekea thalattae]|uniref:DUF58 domain-containing protein n=1 Tax=Reinekea thalattae TaxID=2593301 RepID=A0A5C8ZA06_9GAMM|nr:DUF58 domain-containing protein [Reinekea thalattae]TXR54109.1 DUF58 domain-containing protein [Reinekea thalattae]
MQQSLSIRGTDVAVEDLLALQLMANDLSAIRSARTVSQRQGELHSAFKGQGREFAEMKHYVTGDDSRQIDWRQTAKKQTPFVRVMEEDRHAQQAVWLDLSASSYFGTQHCFKSVMACYWAAFLVWRFLHLNYPVRLFIRVGDQWQQEASLSQRSDGARACQLIATAHRYLADHFLTLNPPSNSNILHWNDRPNLWFISDFLQINQAEINHSAPASLFSQCTFLQAADPFDWQLPEAGLLPIEANKQQRFINSSNRDIQKNYRQQAEQRQQRLESTAAQRGGLLHTHFTQSFEWQEVLSWPL